MTMAKTIRTFVVLEEGVSREEVQSALPATAGDVDVTNIVEGFDEAWQMLEQTASDLLVVACTGHSDRTLYFIENAVRDRPSRPVVVLCESSPNGFVKRVFEVGADDILRLPEASDTVYFAFQKALARKNGGAGSADHSAAPLVCVLGPKGGTGKTLIASNLGVYLAQQGYRVAAVDLDLQFGDLGLSLGLSPERTIADLARANSIEPESVGHYLVEHDSGLRILLAPSRPDQAGIITVDLLREIYAALRASNDFVIVDTPPGFTPEVIASVDSSTGVILVGMLDALSLKNTKLGLETLDLMGYDRSAVRIVLNRADSRVGISQDDVAAVLGRAPDVLIPSDRDVPRALNEGLAIVLAQRQSGVARAFKVLADLYPLKPVERTVTPEVATAHASSRRLLGRRA